VLLGRPELLDLVGDLAQPILRALHARPGARAVAHGAIAVPPGSHAIVARAPWFRDFSGELPAERATDYKLVVELARLVPVELAPATATVMLDDKPVAIEGGVIAVPRGSYALVARAPGFRDRRIEIPAVRAADYKLAVKLESVRAVPVAVPRATGGLTAQRKIALVMGVAGLGIAGIGALGDHQDPRSGDTGTSSAVYGIAGGTLLVAAALWLTGAPQKPAAVNVAPRLGTVTGLDLAVRF
jgi:hypothetical protein